MKSRGRWVWGVLALLLAVALPAGGQTLGSFEVERVPEDEAPPQVVTDPDVAVLVVESEIEDVSFQSNRGVLNVQKQGSSTYLVKLAPGTHLLSFQAPGYRDVNGERFYLPAKQAKMVRLAVTTASAGGRGTLVVRSDPTAAEVTLNSIALNRITPLELPDQPAGTHKLRLEREGYYTLDTTVTVEGGEENTYDFTLRRAVSSLRVQSEPAGATVVLDGDELGITPLTRTDLAPGVRSLVVQLAGYEANVQTVRLEPGEETFRDVFLAPLTGRIVVQAPAGALILLDGAPRGTVPADGTLELDKVKVGPHDLLARMEGHDDAPRNVSVQANKTTRVSLNPSGRPGSLYVVSTPPGAEILLDGRSTGVLTPGKVESVSAGSHTLILTLEGFRTASRGVTVEAAKTVTVQLALEEGGDRPSPRSSVPIYEAGSPQQAPTGPREGWYGALEAYYLHWSSDYVESSLYYGFAAGIGHSRRISDGLFHKNGVGLEYERGTISYQNFGAEATFISVQVHLRSLLMLPVSPKSMVGVGLEYGPDLARTMNPWGDSRMEWKLWGGQIYFDAGGEYSIGESSRLSFLFSYQLAYVDHVYGSGLNTDIESPSILFRFGYQFQL